MGLSVFPEPSASSASTPIGSGPTVAVGTETKGWYRTTLAAGSYYIYAYTPENSISIQAYNNNIYTTNVTGISSRPYKLTLTTSDTVYLGAPWIREVNNANVAGNPNDTFQLFAPNQYEYNDNAYAHWWTMNSGRGLFTQGFWNGSQQRLIVTPYDVSAAIPVFRSFSGGHDIAAANYPGYGSYAGTRWFVTERSGTGRLFYSTNTTGSAWANVQVSGQVGPYNYVYFGGGMYVLLSEGGANTALSSSTDGVTWATRGTAGSSHLVSGTYGAGIHVVGGNGGLIYTSTDGYTWTSRTSGLSSTISSIKYGTTTGLFMAVCRQTSSNGATTPQMARSTDGITWTTMNPQFVKKGIDIAGSPFAGWIYGFTNGNDNADAPNYHNAVVEHDGAWYINSSYGGTLVSTDGINWGYIAGGAQDMSVVAGKLVGKFVQNRRTIYFNTPAPLGYAIYQA